MNARHSLAVVCLSTVALLGCKDGALLDSADTEIQANCASCGEVEAITPLKVKGEARPVAALAGAVIGGVIGHQFGSGSGNDAATAAGAVGGAIAGSELDRQHNTKTVYQVVVRLGSGERVEFTKPAHPGVQVGDEVRLQGDRILPLS